MKRDKSASAPTGTLSLSSRSATPLDEDGFKEGVLVSYYREGTRYGHVIDSDIDDDGDLEVRVMPIGAKGAVKKALKFKSKHLTIA